MAKGKEAEVQWMPEGHTALSGSGLCHHACHYCQGRSTGTLEKSKNAEGNWFIAVPEYQLHL